MNLLTHEQNVLDFIGVHHDLKGYPPSLRQIAAAVDQPITTAAETVRDLQTAGLLTKQPRTPRTVRLTEAGHAHRRAVTYL